MTSKIQLTLDAPAIQAFFSLYPKLGEFIPSLIASYERLWARKTDLDSAESSDASLSSAYVIWALRLQDAMQFLNSFFDKLLKEETVTPFLILCLFKKTLEEDERYSRDNVLGDLHAYSNLSLNADETNTDGSSYFSYLNLSPRSNLILLLSPTLQNTTQNFHQLIIKKITYLLQYHEPETEEKPYRFHTSDLIANPEALNPYPLWNLQNELVYIPERNRWLSLASIFRTNLPFDEAIIVLKERMHYLYRKQGDIYKALIAHRPLSFIIKRLLPQTFYNEIQSVFEKLENHLDEQEADESASGLGPKKIDWIRSLSDTLALDTSNAICLLPFELHEAYTLKKLISDLWEERITNNTFIWGLRTFLKRYQSHACNTIPIPSEHLIKQLKPYQSNIENASFELSLRKPKLPTDPQQVIFLKELLLNKRNKNIRQLTQALATFENKPKCISMLAEHLLNENEIKSDFSALYTLVIASGKALGLALFKKITEHFHEDFLLLLKLFDAFGKTWPEVHALFPPSLTRSHRLTEKPSLLIYLAVYYHEQLSPLYLSLAKKIEALQSNQRLSNQDAFNLLMLCKKKPVDPLTDEEYQAAMNSLVQPELSFLNQCYHEKRSDFKRFIERLTRSLIIALSNQQFSFAEMATYLDLLLELEKMLHLKGQLINYFDLNTQKPGESVMRKYSYYPAERFLQEKGLARNGLVQCTPILSLPTEFLDKYYFSSLEHMARQILTNPFYEQSKNLIQIKEKILPYFDKLSHFWTQLFVALDAEKSGQFMCLLNSMVISTFDPAERRRLFPYFLGSIRYLLQLENLFERHYAFGEFLNSLSHPYYTGLAEASANQYAKSEESKFRFIESITQINDLAAREAIANAYMQRQPAIFIPNNEETFIKIFNFLGNLRHTKSNVYEIDLYLLLLKTLDAPYDFYEALVISLKALRFASRDTLRRVLALIPSHCYPLFIESMNLDVMLRDPLAAINLCTLKTHLMDLSWSYLKTRAGEFLRTQNRIEWKDYFFYCIRSEDEFYRFCSILLPDIIKLFTTMKDFIYFMRCLPYTQWHEAVLKKLPKNYLMERSHDYHDLKQLTDYLTDFTSLKTSDDIPSLHYLNDHVTYVSNTTIFISLCKNLFDIQNHVLLEHVKKAFETFLFSILKLPVQTQRFLSHETLTVIVLINFPRLNEYLEELDKAHYLDTIKIPNDYRYYENANLEKIFSVFFFRIKNINILRKLFSDHLLKEFSCVFIHSFILQHSMLIRANRKKLFELFDLTDLTPLLVTREALEMLFHYAQLENQGSKIILIIEAYMKLVCNNALPPRRIPPALLNKLLYDKALCMEKFFPSNKEFFNFCRSLDWQDLKLFWELRYHETLLALKIYSINAFSFLAIESITHLEPAILRNLWSNKEFYHYLNLLFQNPSWLVKAIAEAKHPLAFCKMLSNYVQARFKNRQDTHSFLVTLRQAFDNQAIFTELLYTLFPQFKVEHLPLLLFKRKPEETAAQTSFPPIEAGTVHVPPIKPWTRANSCVFFATENPLPTHNTQRQRSLSQP